MGGRLWVRPPWAPPRPGALDLVVDPGQAFGTGAHPTTKLSLELMLELDPGGSFADLGCGSGVLAIAAAKLGFAPLVAVDNELAALDATRANAAANGVELDAVERSTCASDRRRPPTRSPRTWCGRCSASSSWRAARARRSCPACWRTRPTSSPRRSALRERRRLVEGGWAALLLR